MDPFLKKRAAVVFAAIVLGACAATGVQQEEDNYRYTQRQNEKYGHV